MGDCERKSLKGHTFDRPQEKGEGREREKGYKVTQTSFAFA